MEAHTHPEPEEVGVRELRQNLSVYLRRIREGEQFTVTERGVPVAELGPLRKPTSIIEELKAQGLLIPASNPGGMRDLPPGLKPDPNAPPLQQIFDELREDTV